MVERSEIAIIGVDLDNTLTKETCWTPEECLAAVPNDEMVKIVNKLFEKHFIVIYTSRKDDLIPASLRWLRRNEIKFNAFSNNKTALDYYIDDKNLLVDTIPNFRVRSFEIIKEKDGIFHG